MIVQFESEFERIAGIIGAEYQTKKVSELEDFIQGFDFTTGLVNSIPTKSFQSNIGPGGALVYNGDFKIQFLTKAVKSNNFESVKNVLIDEMILLSEQFFLELNKNALQIFGTVPFEMRTQILRQYTSNFCVGVETSITFNTRCSRLPVKAPSGLSAVLFGTITNDLTWVDNTLGDFDLNHIERSLDNDSGFVQIDTTTNPTSYRDLTITDTSALTYFYRVRASKNGIFSGYSNISFVNTIDLRLDLDLQANDPNLLILNSLDVVSDLSKSETLEEVNVYTSDFSSGVDGWFGSKLSVTGNIDSIGGLDNWLRHDIDSTSGQHISIKGGFTVGKVNNGSLLINIPSTNTDVDGFTAQFGGHPEAKEFDSFLELGAINDDITRTISIPKNLWKSNTNFIIFLTKGGVQSFLGNGSDRIYIKNVIIGEIQGDHFTQATPANRMLANSATIPTKITALEANSEFLENTLNVAKFAAMSQGSVMLINSQVSNIYSFTIGDSSSLDDYFYIGIESGGKAICVSRVSGVELTNTSDSVLSIDDPYEWKKENGVVKLMVKGLEVGHTGNHNNWISNSNNLDNMRIGSLSRSTPLFSNVINKALQVKSVPNTAFETLRASNELIARHNL